VVGVSIVKLGRGVQKYILDVSSSNYFIGGSKIIIEINRELKDTTAKLVGKYILYAMGGISILFISTVLSHVFLGFLERQSIGSELYSLIPKFKVIGLFLLFVYLLFLLILLITGIIYELIEKDILIIKSRFPCIRCQKHFYEDNLEYFSKIEDGLHVGICPECSTKIRKEGKTKNAK